MDAAQAAAAQAEAAAANAVKVMSFMYTMQVFSRKLLGGHNVHRTVRDNYLG
jgi:hypothetical protein